MKPALFISPYIYSYPVLLLAGFIFGWWLARRRSQAFGILPREIDNIGLLLPIAGLFGARLFARLFYAKLPLLEALRVWEGDGLVFYGGFLFGIGAVVIYGLVRRMRLLSLFDCLAPSAALGLAFGRIGCFLAGCCWGDVCVDRARLWRVHDTEVIARIQTIPAISDSSWPIAVRFPEGSDPYKQHAKWGLLDSGEPRSVPVHPVQLYEAVLAFALCAYLVWRSKAMKQRPGDVALALLIGYGLIRFGTEFLRADNKVFAFDFTFSQVVSIAILLGSLLLISGRAIFRRHRKACVAGATKPYLASMGGSGSKSSI